MLMDMAKPTGGTHAHRSYRKISVPQREPARFKKILISNAGTETNQACGQARRAARHSVKNDRHESLNAGRRANVADFSHQKKLG